MTIFACDLNVVYLSWVLQSTLILAHGDSFSIKALK